MRQMSQRSSVSIISISFDIDFFFKIGFPPSASSFESKIRLKSPPNIICLLDRSLISLIKIFNFDNVWSCSDSVFELYMLIKT